MSNVSKLNATTLSKPITIDGQEVTDITLRKPQSGELRGLALLDIMRMDVNAMIKLIPRISQPPLSEQQVASVIETEDLMDMAGKVTLFFAKRQQLEGQVLELQPST